MLDVDNMDKVVEVVQNLLVCGRPKCVLDVDQLVLLTGMKKKGGNPGLLKNRIYLVGKCPVSNDRTLTS